MKIITADKNGWVERHQRFFVAVLGNESVSSFDCLSRKASFEDAAEEP